MTIRVLIVDDSPSKTEQISDLILRIIPDVAPEIHVATDASEAARMLHTSRYDLLVLDINLPLRQGEGPRREGGLEVLRYIRTRKGANRPTHIVGLSGYEDLVSDFTKVFSDEMWYLIGYDSASDEWRQQLAHKLVHIADSVVPPPIGDYRTDLAIITALHQVELEAVLDIEAGWERQTWPDDSAIYYHGTFVNTARALSVVAASAPGMGMPAATAMAMKAIFRYRPRYIAMVGIAAGVKGHFGDVLVAEQSWDYGSGKARPPQEGRSIFLPAPSYIPLSPHLKARFQAFALNKTVLRNIQLRWKGPESFEAPLQVLMGPVASGAAVLENPEIVAELVENRNRKLIGVEMETYGVFLAAQQATSPAPQAMSIKSICDFADERKNDEYQRYAAFTSAQYLLEFALAELASDSESD